ncbi:MAG: ABC transporter permease [Chlamydiales bacterium]
MLKISTFYFYLLRTSLRASISRRGAFLIEASLIAINNLIFFSIWWIFFRQFKDIGGWQFIDMVALMAIGTGAYGLAEIFFGGVKTLSSMIISGDLDPFLTQPKDPLLHIAGSRSLAKGWGHLMTTLLLVTFSSLATWSTTPLILISLLSGCLVFTAMRIMAHSLPFWMGSVEGLSKKYCDALFLFALYPTNIYSGILQLFMFTVIPAGIIGYLPVELIRDFSWDKLFILLGSSVVLFALAFFVFRQGLKRYESGNRFGLRGG